MDSLFLTKLAKVVFNNNETVKTGADLITLLENSDVHRGNPFHNETLFEHLIRSGSGAHGYAVSRGWTDKDKWLYFVGGFLHDVGKPGSQRPLFRNKNKKNKNSLKGHAVCGAAMMDSWLLNESFLSEFGLTTQEAGMIATVTNLHMCAYSKDKHHVELLRKAAGCLEAARLLCAVRHGDSMAKSPPQYVDDRFEETMLSEYSNGSIFPKNNKGLLINVTGFSGCGKSTLARQTLQFLEEKYNLKLGVDVFWINRDRLTLDVVATEEPHLNEREAFGYYQRNKERLSPRVNAEINAKLTEVLAAGERVCILDTMALMNPHVRNVILKNVPRDTVTIELWAHRRETSYSEEEASRRRGGMTLAQQLSINSRNVTSDMDVIGSAVAWDALNSVMENRYTQGGPSTKSMYVIPIGHNSYLMRGQYIALLGRLMDERGSQAPPPLLSDDTINTTLHELVSDLVASDMSLERLKRFFKSHAFTVSIKEFGAKKCLVSIKYIDRQNKIMSHKWAREARGMGFVVDISDEASPFVEVIKRPLERCVEVLSCDNARNGIGESQDMNSVGDLSFLNREQREVVEMFNFHACDPLDENEGWFITPKVDGCLLVVSVFNEKDDKRVYKYMTEAVKACDMWHVFDENGLLYVPSTSGSLGVGADMKTTLITAAAGTLGAHGLLASHDPDWVWYEANLGRDLMRALSDYYPFNFKTMIMEMVCANRTTYDGKKEHFEIAVSYPHSALYVLGCYGDDGLYTPVYSMNSVQSTTFREPRSVRIDTPAHALAFLKDLSDLTTSNRKRSSPLARDFHPEGYILTRHNANEVLLASCKLKTSEYYKAHALGGILNKMYDSKTGFLMTVEEATESGALNANDTSTIDYMRRVAATDDTDEEGSVSPIGVASEWWGFKNIFPEVDKFLYVSEGFVRQDVRAFCDAAMASIVEPIAKGREADVDYTKLPSSIVDQRLNVDVVNGGEAYENVCQCIISAPAFDDKRYRAMITGLFRRMFGAHTHTDEQVHIMARRLLRINKSWRKNEAKETKVPKDFIQMVVSGI